ncbi:hypothetical protein R1flu_004951 [Riccia fluitans]|uniref:Uncharacterized protein n=1 Tax=Riccia fluitans TaxID=41844 RepID=A0ABD1YVR3_9MARC
MIGLIRSNSFVIAEPSLRFFNSFCCPTLLAAKLLEAVDSYSSPSTAAATTPASKRRKSSLSKPDVDIKSRHLVPAKIEAEAKIVDLLKIRSLFTLSSTRLGCHTLHGRSQSHSDTKQFGQSWPVTQVAQYTMLRNLKAVPTWLPRSGE